jgi:hypothetical protein
MVRLEVMIVDCELWIVDDVIRVEYSRKWN